MDQILIWIALVLSVANALLPLAKKLARKTKNKTDDNVVEFLEDALNVAKAVQDAKKADLAKKK
tara:strand:- start:625 stop:816 length:192 start_codon:yes stop_codon:yes gene_type:complete